MLKSSNPSIIVSGMIFGLTFLELLAQGFGLISLIIVVISLHQKKKATLIKLQMTSNFSSAIQYCLLGGITGGLTHLVYVMRNYGFNKYSRRRIFSSWLFFVVVFLLVVFTALAYDGPASLLPLMAILIYTFALIFGSMKTIRIVNILTCFISIAYSFYVGAYVAIITSTVEIAAAAHALWTLDRKPKS